jgi:hypothetical protein
VLLNNDFKLFDNFQFIQNAVNYDLVKLIYSNEALKKLVDFYWYFNLTTLCDTHSHTLTGSQKIYDQLVEKDEIEI